MARSINLNKQSKLSDPEGVEVESASQGPSGQSRSYIQNALFTQQSTYSACPNMRFKAVAHSLVAADVKRHTKKKTGSPSVRARKFNTSKLAKEVILDLVPDVPHRYPNTSTTDLSAWLPLIVRSHGFTGQHHEFSISASLAGLIDSAIKVHQSGKEIPPKWVEDAVGLFPATSAADVLTNSILSGNQSWFLRLASCSPKDSEYFGPACSPRDIVRMLFTSPRSFRALLYKTRDSADEEEVCVLGPGRLFLLPWEFMQDTESVYRVFVPPVAHIGPNVAPTISAVSQLYWAKAWPKAPCRTWRTVKPEVRACRVLSGAWTLLEQIENFAQNNKGVPEGTWERMRGDGFVYDVCETVDGSVALVELNAFGAMSECESALFEWKRDAKKLYALGQDGEIEFRVVDEKEG